MRKIEVIPEVSCFLDYARQGDLPLEAVYTSDNRVFGQDGMRRFLDFCQTHPAQVSEAISQVAERMEEMNTYKACAVSLFIGSFTEQGVECTADESIMAYFVKVAWWCYEYLGRVADLLGVSLGELTDEQLQKVDAKRCYAQFPRAYEAVQGSHNLTMCVMSRICRRRELREWLRGSDQLTELCEYLSRYWGWFGYVHTVLEMAEEESIVVLFPEREAGVEVLARQVDSCFLFMTLFQLEMSRVGLFREWGIDYVYDEELCRMAHNLVSEEEEADRAPNDAACLEYYTPYALQPDGSYCIIKTDEEGNSVIDPSTRLWGEQPLQSLPRIDGIVVLLADSHPLMSRTWSGSYVTSAHPALRPELSLVRALAGPEYEQWMRKVRDIRNR